MPVLGDSQGHLIPKSIITCEYLEEEYQEKLFTDDPYGKVCQRMTFERFSEVLPLLTSLLGWRKGRRTFWHKKKIEKRIPKVRGGDD